MLPPHTAFSEKYPSPLCNHDPIDKVSCSPPPQSNWTFPNPENAKDPRRGMAGGVGGCRSVRNGLGSSFGLRRDTTQDGAGR